MILSFFSMAYYLSVSGHGHALNRRAAVGSMTFYNYARYCQNDGSNCLYTFGIEEDPDMCQFSPCVFTVDAKGGKFANQSDFQSAECKDMRYNYHVNGGWDSSGYMTLVVTNTDLHTYTYVSYQDSEMQNGKTVISRTQQSYQVGSFDRAPKGVARRGGEKSSDDGDWWQIQDMFRTWDTTFGTVDMIFNITLSNGTKHKCEILLQDSDHPNSVGSWSFYNQACNHNDFSVSWGYNETGDFAVVTLCSPDRSQRAFFGFKNVSNTQRLGDTNKSTIQDIAC